MSCWVIVFYIIFDEQNSREKLVFLGEDILRNVGILDNLAITELSYNPFAECG